MSLLRAVSAACVAAVLCALYVPSASAQSSAGPTRCTALLGNASLADYSAEGLAGGDSVLTLFGNFVAPTDSAAYSQYVFQYVVPDQGSYSGFTPAAARIRMQFALYTDEAVPQLKATSSVVSMNTAWLGDQTLTAIIPGDAPTMQPGASYLLGRSTHTHSPQQPSTSSLEL